MLFDLEELHPEEPRVPRGLSWGDRALLTALLHVLFLLAIIFLPRLSMFQTVPVPLRASQDPPIQFVDIEPRLDRKATPLHTPVPSDLDRRSSTPQTIPKPQNDMALSHGNTPEKVVGAPEERAKGPETPQPAPPSPTAPTQPAPPVPDTGTVLPETVAHPPSPSASSAGSLGDSLHNLQRYLRNENFDNPQGGQTQSNADIQFDSKGVDFAPWLRRFRLQVMSNWFVPEAAALQKGHVVFQFYVARDGTISDIHIVEPSSIQAFNLAAESALRMSNPTVPLPAEYPSDRILFTVKFFYNEAIH